MISSKPQSFLTRKAIFVGYYALALQGAQKAPTIIAVAIPVVSCDLPILETALSILRRFICGRPVFTADREHIHHKLLQRGLTHRQVVIVLYAVFAGLALLSFFPVVAHGEHARARAGGPGYRNLGGIATFEVSGAWRDSARRATHSGAMANLRE